MTDFEEGIIDPVFFAFMGGQQNEQYLIAKQDFPEQNFEYLELTFKGPAYNYSIWNSEVLKKSSLPMLVDSAVAQGPNIRILMLGLGIGYDAFTLAKLPNVTEIVVVEREQLLIDLITPLVTSPKITYVRDTALSFLQAPGIDRYDIVYSDIFIDDPSHFPDEVQTITIASVNRLAQPGGELIFWRRWQRPEL